jgi:uncharacterized protein YjbI with pentapeptide repeats
MKVGKDADFSYAIFNGPVVFRYASIEFNFRLNGAHFCYLAENPLPREIAAEFDGNFMRVGKIVSFNKTYFAGQTSLSWAKISHLHLDNSKSKLLILEGTKIEEEFRIVNTEINKFICSDLIVNGAATFKDARLSFEVNLRGASFQRVNLIDVDWPKDVNPL